MNLKEMLEAKVRQQDEIINNAKNAKRELTSEEKENFNELQKSIDELKEKIKEENSGEFDNTQQNNDMFTERAIVQERRRISDISDLCREFNISPEKTSNFINNNTSVDKVREEIIKELKENKGAISIKGTADVTKAEEDKVRAAAADALVMRGGVSIEKPVEGARDFMKMSLRDLAIECVQRETGETNLHRKSADEIFGDLMRTFYSPTAAFPAILDTAINKAYVEGHKTAPVTFDKFCKIGSLKDFKTHDNNYLAGPAGEFLEVPEGGEIKHDVPKDEKRPTRKLRTYARQFTMTRQAFVNDDIDFLSKIPAKYAASARKTQNKQVFEILFNNPVIYDGVRLFDKVHKNVIATGSGINQQAVQSMLMALQLQTDAFGEAIIIRPACIVVPIGYSFDIYTLFESPTISTTGNTQSVNPLYRYRSVIEVIEDPTLNILAEEKACPWFIFGDKADTDGIEVDYLNGQEIPSIRRMETPGQLGYVWDIYLDWGVSVMDYRGITKNPGIELINPL